MTLFLYPSCPGVWRVVWTYDGHVTSPSFSFSCVLARGANPVAYQRIVFGLLLGTSTVAFFLLFLCACARASPAIVFFSSVAVCFVWYSSVDTPTVVCARQRRGYGKGQKTQSEDGVSALSGEQDALLSWSAAAGANRNLMRWQCKNEHWRRRSAT